MSIIFAIASKEFRDAWRDKLILLLIGSLGLLVVLSIVTDTQHLGIDVAKYQAAVQQIKQSGQVSTLTPPSFAPLHLLRSSIEYFEIIGAVLAIVIGYASIARERANNTLPLLLSRGITGRTFALGKLLGNVLLIGLIVLSFLLFAVIAIGVIGNLWLSSPELIKLGLAGLYSVLYLTIFFAISALLSSRIRHPVNALVVALILWVGFVLVLPQIGDTMDVDNQVPGGFFASLNLPKDAEKQVLTHFTAYENFRNGTEVASPTKHYERASFAFLGIKQIYEGKTLAEVWHDKWPNVVVLGSIAILSAAGFVISMQRINASKGGI